MHQVVVVTTELLKLLGNLVLVAFLVGVVLEPGPGHAGLRLESAAVSSLVSQSHWHLVRPLLREVVGGGQRRVEHLNLLEMGLARGSVGEAGVGLLAVGVHLEELGCGIRVAVALHLRVVKLVGGLLLELAECGRVHVLHLAFLCVFVQPVAHFLAVGLLRRDLIRLRVDLWLQAQRRSEIVC